MASSELPDYRAFYIGSERIIPTSSKLLTLPEQPEQPAQEAPQDAEGSALPRAGDDSDPFSLEALYEVNLDGHRLSEEGLPPTRGQQQEADAPRDPAAAEAAAAAAAAEGADAAAAAAPAAAAADAAAAVAAAAPAGGAGSDDLPMRPPPTSASLRPEDLEPATAAAADLSEASAAAPREEGLARGHRLLPDDDDEDGRPTLPAMPDIATALGTAAFGAETADSAPAADAEEALPGDLGVAVKPSLVEEDGPEGGFLQLPATSSSLLPLDLELLQSMEAVARGGVAGAAATPALAPDGPEVASASAARAPDSVASLDVDLEEEGAEDVPAGGEPFQALTAAAPPAEAEVDPFAPKARPPAGLGGAPAPREDPFVDGLQSSASYFPFQGRTQAAGASTASKKAATPGPAAGTTPAAGDGGGAPFPESPEAIALRRVAGHEAEVAALAQTAVAAVTGAGAAGVRLAELRRVQQEAAALQNRLGLSEAHLEAVRWPSETLSQISAVLERVDRWQSLLDAAQRLVREEEGTAPAAGPGGGTAAVELLEELAGAWLALREPSKKLRGVDLGLEQRARSAAPLVSALVDHVTSSAASAPDAGGLQRLLRFLGDPLMRQVLEVELGAVLPQAGTMKDLSAVAGPGGGRRHVQWAGEGMGAAATPPQRQRGGVAAPLPPAPPAPEVFLQALGTGHTHVAEAMLRQGVITTGRAHDGRGHSILWLAIAMQLPDLALLVIRCFPPPSQPSAAKAAEAAADFGEVHSRRGDTLLHLACSTPKAFDAHWAELFKQLLAYAPSETLARANEQGQNFLHIAAARLNLWVLSHVAAARPSAAWLCTQRDKAGWSPLALLARHLCKRHGAPAPPAAPQMPARLERWDRPAETLLGGNARAAAAPVSFADVEVEVWDDATQQRVRLQAHRVMLAAASPKWHDQLRRQGSTQPAVLRVDNRYCRSAAVMREALHCAYDGDLLRRASALDSQFLWQLLCVLVGCGFAEALRHDATVALLRGLDYREPRCAQVLAPLLRSMHSLRLSTEHRRYALYCLLCSNRLGYSTEESQGGAAAAAGETLRHVVAELEACLG